jgi:subtilisin family serine protease
MRRLVAVALALLVATPLAGVLGAGTALAAASAPALVPAALTGSEPVRAGALDASNRWVVVLRAGATDAQASSRATGLGITAGPMLHGTIHGYSARLTTGQLDALRADPRVADVVPDGIVSMTAQRTPTGIRRVYGLKSPIANIDGADTRVDADVAIVDTGIDGRHPDLNVAGGMNCTSSNPRAWADNNGHGTHVAGTVGALDNGIGVVGVAPGVRLWAVKILDSAGNGLISWYVCGLDWITAQRDAADPTRPMVEAVNMSVAKVGSDDRHCGLTNHDLMHQAVCRLVASGVTVAVAAGNNTFNAARLIPASYNEVITVSALADSDGRPGGLGGIGCATWPAKQRDDSIALFSNYGADVDLIAPGKCILSTLPNASYGLLSGTSMATPLVTGAVALYKSTRPLVTPAQVRVALQAMGNLNWRLSSDPDPYHERLLDVSWIVNLGDFAMRSVVGPSTVGAAGATRAVPMNVVRAEDLAVPLDLSVTALAPLVATLSVTHLAPTDGGAISVRITVPPATASGLYPVTVTASDGTRQRSAAVTVKVDTTPPVVTPAALGAVTGTTFGTTRLTGVARWAAAVDAGTTVTAYQAQWSVDGGTWGSTASAGAGARSLVRTFVVGHRYAVRLRARDGIGNWSAWVTAPATVPRAVQDTSRAITWTGAWRRSVAKAASGGSTHSTYIRGHAATLAFHGRGIALVAPFGPRQGRLQVWIDGVLAATLNEHATRSIARHVMFTRTGLVDGDHTIRIVALGTAGHSRVDVDAFVVLP